MGDIKNTVDAANQLAIDRRVTGDSANGRPRVLFVGNSITLHDKKPDIGWFHNWGMAASDINRDYVHQTMKLIRKIKPEASYRIAQAAEWEQVYWKGSKVLQSLSEAAVWCPDIVIVRIGENIPIDALANYPLVPAFMDLLDYFNPQGEAQEVITTLFKQTMEVDSAIAEVANIRNIPLADITSVGANNDMMALGLFQHQGVAGHPGDKGMQFIADAIFKIVEPLLIP